MLRTVDSLRQDDILSARVFSPGEKLSQALEVMAYGLELERRKLQQSRPDASVTDIEHAFDAWSFARG